MRNGVTRDCAPGARIVRHRAPPVCVPEITGAARTYPAHALTRRSGTADLRKVGWPEGDLWESALPLSARDHQHVGEPPARIGPPALDGEPAADRKSTRLNSSH